METIIGIALLIVFILVVAGAMYLQDLRYQKRINDKMFKERNDVI